MARSHVFSLQHVFFLCLIVFRDKKKRCYFFSAPQVQVVVRQVAPGYPQEMHFPSDQYGYAMGNPQPQTGIPQPMGITNQPMGMTAYDQPTMTEAAPPYSAKPNIV